MADFMFLLVNYYLHINYNTNPRFIFEGINAVFIVSLKKQYIYFYPVQPNQLNMTHMHVLPIHFVVRFLKS